MTLFFAFSSAFLYIAATFVMKQWSSLDSLLALILIAVTLSGGAVCEIIALRHERLGHVYVLILGIECILAVLCAWYLLRESYAPLEVLGLALIVVGVLLVHLPFGAKPEAALRETGSTQTKAPALAAVERHTHSLGSLPAGPGAGERSGAAVQWPVCGIAV